MACLTEEQALELVASGDLDARAPQVSDHLDACDKCRSFVSALATMRELDEPGKGGLAPGARIGRFVLRRRIGEGGMGVVWEAEDPHLGRAVALKCLHPELATDASNDREQTLREARAAARLNHPNVVTVFDAIEHDGAIFIALELAPRGTLSAWLREAPRSVVDVVRAYVDAGRGLAAAHREGIVHGDFKPDNVLRASDGRFMVTDFGLACIGDAAGACLAGVSHVSLASARRSSSMVGAAFFMAPERMRGGVATARADQYAFAIALAAALGAIRGPGEIAKRAHGVPAAILGVLARAASASADARYSTMDELVTTLEALIARRSVSRRLAIGVAVAGISLGLGSAAWAFVPEPLIRPSHFENGDIERGGKTPDVWTLSGSGSKDADLVRTTAVAHSGRASAQLVAHGARTSNYITAMEIVAAHDYRGKRVRASVWIRTSGATERADFWLRARLRSPSGDGPELGSGSVELPPTTDWKRYEIELEIPPTTRVIDFGVGLDGPGTLWFDDASFEVIR